MSKRVFYFKLIFVLLAVAVVVACLELYLTFFVFKENTVYGNVRNYLIQDHPVAESVAQPYLNYISNPALKEKHDRYNNNAGLRLDYEVAIAKPDSVFRILFLGGSTTYGCLVKDTDSYPYLLGQKLNALLPDASTKYKRVECLNGGMGGATSAEILTHYIFKYQYLSPDLILVNAGINDCGAYGTYHGAVYQPDYHHWRLPLENIKEPSALLKTLMRSKLISLLVLRTTYNYFFSMDITRNEFQHFNHDYPWFTYGNDSMYTARFNGLYNNLNSLIQVAQNKKQQVLLVTEVIDTLTMPKDFIGLYSNGLQKNNELLKKLAADTHVAFLELNNQEFTSALFVNDDLDGVHLNPTGERLKAERMKPMVFKIMRGEYPLALP